MRNIMCVRRNGRSPKSTLRVKQVILAESAILNQNAQNGRKGTANDADDCDTHPCGRLAALNMMPHSRMMMDEVRNVSSNRL